LFDKEHENLGPLSTKYMQSNIMDYWWQKYKDEKKDIFCTYGIGASYLRFGSEYINK